ncbi:MAG: hypothetical protein ACREP6_05860 [Candidatus Binataceae bacterium]
MKNTRFFFALFIGTAAMLLAISPAAQTASARKINVYIDCRCADPVGQNFCSELKDEVGKSAGYRIAGNARGYGIGVHLACVDLWKGIDRQLEGHMSAVSVVFTIYSDQLPGEIYEDSSVFRLGKNAAPEASSKIISAVGGLVNVNTKFFGQMAAAQHPTPTAAPTLKPDVPGLP